MQFHGHAMLDVTHSSQPNFKSVNKPQDIMGILGVYNQRQLPQLEKVHHWSNNMREGAMLGMFQTLVNNFMFIYE